MKREIFYIRGNKDRASEVKSALLEKYPDAGSGVSYEYEDNYFYLGKNKNIKWCYIDSEEADLLRFFGTELHLPERNESKFYVGDVVKITNTFQDEPLMCITKVNGSSISATDGCVRSVSGHPLTKVKRVTDKEIDKWNKDYLHTRRWHYSKTDRKLKHWFLPFDKVLIRRSTNMAWTCDIFSHYDDKNGEDLYPYITAGGCNSLMCLPYNENTAHLIGTTDDYEEEEL